jgi:predicted DNA-binding transcriptional regulator AlpA
MPKHHNPENATKPEAPPPSPFDQADRLLNVKQVADITGLAVGTLNRARLTGSDAPPYLKISKSVRYRFSSVQAWIANKTEYQHTSAQQASA